MPQSFFIWKGVDCRAKGVNLRGPVSIVRPEERVKHLEIPGRSGDLTQIEGTNIFNSYIQTATIRVKGGFRVREVYDWLRGEDYVTFSGEPDRRQKARIVGAITLDKLSRNLDIWVGEVQFYCQPLKERLRSTLTSVSSGDVVRNYGDVDARPFWHFEADGTSATITVTDENEDTQTLTLTGLTDEDTYWVDSEIFEVMNDDGTSVTKNSSGIFPVLPPGNNTITFTGITSLEIDQRERFL